MRRKSPSGNAGTHIVTPQCAQRMAAEMPEKALLGRPAASPGACYACF